jgi:hypothetical protein
MNIKLNGIEGSESGQKLLPNELFHGEIARANEFGEVGILLKMIFVKFLLKIDSRVDGRSDGKDQNGRFSL